MSDDEDVREAQKFLKEAKSALATGFLSFKFSKDHFAAATNYYQAAQHFRAARRFAEAVDCYKRCGDERENCADTFGSGRAYEEAARICIDFQQNGEGGMSFYDLAVRQYRLAAKPQAAANVLLKKIEFYDKQGDFAKTREMYEQILEVYRDGEIWYEVSTILGKLINVLIRANLRDPTLVPLADIGRTMDEYRAHLVKYSHAPDEQGSREVLAKVVLYLYHEKNADTADAIVDQGCSEFKKFMGSREFGVCLDLIQAFRNHDAAKLEDLRKLQQFSFLHLEIAKLAKKLELGSASDRLQQEAAARFGGDLGTVPVAVAGNPPGPGPSGGAGAGGGTAPAPAAAAQPTQEDDEFDLA